MLGLNVWPHSSAAWHAHKFVDPTESGAVLPVLHVNGFKISERTIPGTMDDLELACLYTGYGYQVRIVEYGANLPADASEKQHEESINLDMAASFKWAYGEIRRIQKAARDGKPMCVLCPLLSLDVCQPTHVFSIFTQHQAPMAYDYPPIS